MAYNNATVLNTLLFFFYLLSNASGMSVPKQVDVKPHTRIIHTSLTTTSKPDKDIEYKGNEIAGIGIQDNGMVPERKFRKRTTMPWETTEHWIWIPSYYIVDDDYPLFRAKIPLPKNYVSRGSNIFLAQMVPFIRNMIVGPKNLSKKRGAALHRWWENGVFM